MKFLHYRREWVIQSSPEAFWPFISDTFRLNYDRGNFALSSALPRGVRLPNAYHHLRASLLEMEEAPFQWSRPNVYTSYKRFRPNLLLDEIRVNTELWPRAAGGTQVIYEMWVSPGSVIGYLIVPFILYFTINSFDAPIQRYDKIARQPRPSPFAIQPRSVNFAPGGRARLAALQAELRACPVPPDLAERLVEFLSTADDLTVSRLRPYALADHWQVRRQTLLELCLWATRVGLLELRWDVLCPLCRGAKESAATLGTLAANVHCPTCNINFDANFESSVEVVFRITAALRPAQLGEFCVGGPQLTPHIVAQQLLQPSEQRALALQLEEGQYRWRALELSGQRTAQVSASGSAEATLTVQTGGWSEADLTLAPQTTLRLVNATPAEQLVILERTAWADFAVMAKEVTSLQVFRDLFASEALRPGEHITVGSLTVLFTDLRDSTRLYRRAGDAVAFGRVMQHFDVLKQAIAAEGGAIVKTIGDAVMATFVQPVSAVRALLHAQAALPTPPLGTPPLQLKAGIHYGPCIAVTLNERLDYFGSTVNLAARLESVCGKTDARLALSDAVWRDPEVRAYFAAHPALEATSTPTQVRGFEGELIEVWLVREGVARE